VKTQNTINLCQVSLKRDLPIILKNYLSFKKFYEKIKIYIICPSKDLAYFKEKLSYDEFKIISEDTIISFKEFELIFIKESENISYQPEFRKRLSWYYQQILKISFIINFVNDKKQNIIIWDADTVLLKKMDFYSENKSINYGTFNEFHKQYYTTNQKILNTIPKYFISFLNQFISATVEEVFLLEKNLFKNIKIEKKNLPVKISELILKNIFLVHKVYNGSMFSEFELIGQSNYLQNNTKQKPILTLRFGLDGKLNLKQINLVKILNFKHVTYEHSHSNKKSLGMLERQQTWIGLIKIILKSLIKFYLRSLRHNYLYKKNYE